MRRRSAPVRWASIGLLAVAGSAGALYFVAGGSGKKPTLPTKPQEIVTEPTADRVEDSPSEPAEPAPSLELSASDSHPARAAQIAVVLDDVDATLHGLRVTWPGKLGDVPWRAADWLTPERLDRELGALDSQLAGASDSLSRRTREWIAVARPDGARLFALHAAWSAPGASADAIGAELRPLFDRLVAASESVHDAVAADLQAPPPATMASLAWACRVSPLLARLPSRGAANVLVEKGGGSTASPMTMPEPSLDEIRALADRCLDESRAFLAANPADQLDHTEIYLLSLANSTVLGLLQERERRRHAPDTRVFISTAGNLARQSSYVATQRRKHDPTLRAEAEAPPP